MRKVQTAAWALGTAMLGIAGQANGQTAPANPGKSAFAPCAACHAVTPNTARLGPSLHKVVGRKIAGVASYTYSPALKGKKGNWTPGELDKYLTNPRLYAPGTKMSYPGMKDPAKRAALIGYLSSLK